MKPAFNRSAFFTVVSQRAAKEEDPPPKQPDNADILAALQDLGAAVRESNLALLEGLRAALAETVAAIPQPVAPPQVDQQPVIDAVDRLASRIDAIKPASLPQDRTDEVLAKLDQLAAAMQAVRAAVLAPVSLEYDRLGEPYQAVRQIS